MELGNVFSCSTDVSHYHYYIISLEETEYVGLSSRFSHDVAKETKGISDSMSARVCRAAVSSDRRV
jgi:hypothetical protein